MEKKKIAFVHYQIIMGGVSAALIKLIKAIDPVKYDITLFLGYKNGEYEYLVPEYVHIKYHYVDNYRKIVKDRIRSGQFITLGHAAICRGLECLYRGPNKHRERLYFSTRRYPLCDDTVYDCVVAYHHAQMETVTTALYRLKAKKRILWAHSEFYEEEVNYRFLNQQYRKYDRVFCVSKALKEYLSNVFPELSGKIDVLKNQINPEEIIVKSKEPCPIVMKHPAILTVGLITTNKGTHLIPKAVDLLVKAGYDVHWYLVGTIHDDTLLQSEIQKYGVEDRIIFCGLQTNPYPYFRESDCYVQPSFIEGFGLTVMEAKILCKPIVVTPFKASVEQIQNGINGVIAESHTSEALFAALQLFLGNASFTHDCVQVLKNTKYDTQKELKKFYDFIEKE